jgi:selenophosphate synthetase-related protein
MYPGMGFVMTAQPENVDKVMTIFEEAGMTAAKIGEITGTRKLEITNNTEKVVVWDFAHDTIMGIGSVACK